MMVLWNNPSPIVVRLLKMKLLIVPQIDALHSCYHIIWSMCTDVNLSKILGVRRLRLRAISWHHVRFRCYVIIINERNSSCLRVNLLQKRDVNNLDLCFQLWNWWWYFRSLHLFMNKFSHFKNLFGLLGHCSLTNYGDTAHVPLLLPQNLRLSIGNFLVISSWLKMGVQWVLMVDKWLKMGV